MTPPPPRPVLAGCDAGSLCTDVGGLDLALEHHGALRARRVSALADAVVPQQAALAIALLWQRMEASP